MSLSSPSDILQRLKQLREWQESQEQLLKKTKSALNTSGNSTAASDYQTIQGLSAFDSSINDERSPKKTKDLESQVISPMKSFNELLEEKLAQDPGPASVAPKVKRPFLRKGAGLERFRLKPQENCAKVKIRTKVRKKVVTSERTVTPLRAPDLSIQPKATWSKIGDSDDHVRKINAIAQLDKDKNETSEPSEQSLWEKQLEKELLVFEALEQKANNSSFCSTNSEVLRILSSTPSKIKPPVPEEKKVHWESQSEDEDVIETNLGKRQLTELFLRLAESKARRENLPTITDESEDEKSSTTEASSDASSIASTDLESTLKIEKRDIGVSTNEYSPDTCPLCGDDLQKKIGEYEEKIKEVIRDKDRIAELRRQLEQKERELLKKKREFEDERQDLVFELETEKKKLLKEKQAFQMYMKDSQNRPNKKERQEISNLKQEVADLTETLKLKESKNGMTQARLRNQVKQLERENANLKVEVEKLTKENAKLSASQKLGRKSSETKILHEINKNITKLTKESLKTKKPDEKDKECVLVARNKSLDVEDSLLEMERKQDDVETQYEQTFRSQSLPLPGILKTSDNKAECTLQDGSKQIKYPNGNVKTISPDGNLIRIQYFNGDKQETNLLNGTVKYYFSSKDICQTTYADGLEVVEFPEGVTEKQYKDGTCEIILPDGVVQTRFPNGTQETKYTDGSVVKINQNGEKVLLLPNGQKEIETKEYKRREYPDGTVKILYPDGTQETKYANGRVRIKDGNGILIVDTQS